MLIGIAANLESRGLKLDAEILQRELAAIRYEAQIFQDTEPTIWEYQIIIHCERISWANIEKSCDHWLLVNPEWITEQDRPWINRYFTRLLCKTDVGADMCRDLFPGVPVYNVGFTSRDQFDHRVERVERFLHIAGKSSVKGTRAVVDAWRWKSPDGGKMRWPLTVVSDLFSDDLPEGVTLLRNVSDDKLRELQNSHSVHIQPSEYEGFGHVLWEALSTGNRLITTAAPPMDGFKPAVWVDSYNSYKINYATAYRVSAIELLKVARNNEFVRPDTNARYAFLKNQDRFRVLLQDCMRSNDAAKQIISKERRIGFIGNFTETSTETHIKWAIEKLGHSVFEIPEAEVSLERLSHYRALDLLLWVKTPGLMKVNPEIVLQYAKRKNLPTMSLHLDRFWDIPEREDEIGIHPFWRTDTVWTADGGNAAKFRERGVVHNWLRPAVSEVYLHPGTRTEQFACDVCFVGSVQYHKCYPFREKMIKELGNHFGNFRVIDGVRGHRLNDVYASAKVIVGDCIFAGSSHYWSDRVPETFGRHGFMIHPDCKGFDYPCIRYTPQNVDSLIGEIEDCLSRPSWIRRQIAENCFKYTAQFDTWTKRMSEVLASL